eukprot:TRINITY_DN7876_c0_g1_i1.p1 TRINITY_DN7876_c0_g1~~TRINITY_DN7876_c0_g1_i1.p1  ORF type:complete len:426 (+),score=103.65 TRINITY_DN7876_c0_g1_i1:124-1278(+)
MAAEGRAEGHRVGVYALRRKLGSGGFGEVWAVENTKAKKDAALKLVCFDSLDGANLCLKEAATMLRLRHARVVACDDLFLHREGSTLFVCLAMPVFAGDLMPYVRAAPADLSVTRGVLTDVASALAYVHGEGFIHRDIKPQNVLIRGEGPDMAFHLADFGLCRDFDGDTVNSTVGTPYYMAPEQYEARDYGPSVDVWALGVVAFVLAIPQTRVPDNRRSPHRRGTALEPLLRQLLADAPDGLAALLCRQLALDPEQRPSALEVCAVAAKLRGPGECSPPGSGLAGSALPTPQAEEQGCQWNGSLPRRGHEGTAGSALCGLCRQQLLPLTPAFVAQAGDEECNCDGPACNAVMTVRRHHATGYRLCGHCNWGLCGTCVARSSEPS